MRNSKKGLLLLGTAAAMLAVAPIAFDAFGNSSAYAQSSGSGNSGAGGSGGSNGGEQGGSSGGQQGAISDGDDDMSDIIKDVAGNDSDSDRPDWSGEPGGKDDAGGGQPPTSGTTKGDDYGDLFVILRDDNGVPLLTPEGWVQPLDANGDLIPLDDEGHVLDASLPIEVEIGRLNVGRAPTSVLDRRADEVITLFNDATAVSTDAAGRLVLTVDGIDKTIDSPLENLAIYVALLTTGTIPGVSDLPGTDFDFLIDGALTDADLAASVAFLAAATDKTGEFTADEIAYIDTFLGINTVSVGTVTYSDIDYSSFDYDRSSTYDGITTDVLVQQPDGTWLETTVNVYDEVFGSVDYSASGTLDAYTQAADDARAVVEYIHEYQIPE